MLGPVFALFRPLAAFVSGIFSGIVINSFDDDLHHHLPDADGVPNAKKSLIERLESGLRYGFLSLPSDIVVPLFQGLLIAAAIAIFIPPDFIAEYFSSSPYIMLFMMLAVSLPVYVCATASIPIAVVLMAKGVSAGAVFVFLMAGPATNASSIAVVKNILGQKTMYQYLLLISSTAIVFGFFLDSFVTIVHPTMSSFSHIHAVNSYGSLFLTILFLLILINAYVYKYKGEVSKPTNGGNDFDRSQDRLSIVVDGMTCSHCKASVESAVYSCSSVESASVDLLTGQVIVLGSGLDESAIKDKIKGKGFSLK
jgi:copper chaperone CopZ